MAAVQTPFEILGLAHDNYTAKSAKEAYYRLVKKIHPDTNPDRKDAEERMKEVNWAYGILGGEETFATWKRDQERLAREKAECDAEIAEIRARRAERQKQVDEWLRRTAVAQAEIDRILGEAYDEAVKEDKCRTAKRREREEKERKERIKEKIDTVKGYFGLVIFGGIVYAAITFLFFPYKLFPIGH